MIELFTAGIYPQGEITQADLQEMVDSYDPKFHRAPLTLHHIDETPALAFVDQLARQENTLLGSFTEVDEDAYSLARQFRKPSIEIAVYNGKKYLRAVSLTNFPGVKGLPDMKFSEKTTTGTIYGNYSLPELDLNKFINPKGKKMPISEKALKFCESYKLPTEGVNFQEQIINTLADKLSSAESKLSANFKEKCESLVNNAIVDGRLKPNQKDSIIAFAENDFENAKKMIDALPLPVTRKIDTTKPFTETGKPITYSEVIKNPKLAKDLSSEELQALRLDYLNS